MTPADRARGLGRADLASLAAVAAAAVAFQWPTFDRTMSLLDEGHILQFADILHRGGELYRDATLLPLPGAFSLLALAFDLFGPSIRVARWLVLLEFTLFAGVIYLLVRRLESTAVAWAGVALAFFYKAWCFPHWQMYSYSTLAQLVLAVALLAVLHFQRVRTLRAVAIAGFVTGLAVFVKQDYGGAGLLALNAALWISTGRAAHGRGPGRLATLAGFNAGAALVGLAIAARFLAQGLFLEMLRQTLLNHLIGISSGEYSSLPPLRPLFEANPLFREPYGIGAYAPSLVFTADWAVLANSAFYESALYDTAIKLFFYAPYAVAAAGAVRAVRRRAWLADPARSDRALGELTLWCYATAAIAALNKPVDYVHVAVLYWPFLLLLLLWTVDALRHRPRARRAVAALAAGAALLCGVFTLGLLGRLAERYDTPLRGERAGVRVEANEEAVIGGVVDWLRERTRPDERVAVLPYYPLISFLAGRDAPHPETYTLWPIEYTAQREASVIAALENDSADVAVYHFTQAQQLPRMREYAPEVFAYLVEHWEIERVFSDPGWGYMVAGLRRSAAADRGRALLGPGRPPPQVRIARDDGVRMLRGAALDETFRLELWPFRPVAALRPSCPGTTQLRLGLDVPEGARLHSAVGVDPTEWFRHPPSWVDFAFAVIDETGRRHTLWSRRLDPHRRVADRRWFPVELDLAAWSGRRIDLELSTHCEGERGRSLSMGGFEIPRLVGPDDVAARTPLWQAGRP